MLFIINHQVRSVYDMDNDATTFQLWNADGQLTDIYTPSAGFLRHHWRNVAGTAHIMSCIGFS